MRSKVVEGQPQLKNTEVSKLIGEQWGKMSAEEKMPYEMMSAKDKVRYHEEMTKYTLLNPKPSAKKDGVGAVGAELPPTGKELFVKAKEQKYRAANADATDAQVATELEKQWELQEPDAKISFLKEAQQLMTEFEQKKKGDAAEAAQKRKLAKAAAKQSSKPKRQRSAVTKVKNKKMCQVCEQPEKGKMVVCSGICKEVFHPGCLGLSGGATSTFKCDNCTRGIWRCLVCEKPGADLRCNFNGCNKPFHRACAAELPRAKLSNSDIKGEIFECPLHTCANCDVGTSGSYKMIRCARCPVVYHETCVPAGVEVTSSQIVCPRHHEVTKHPSSTFCSVCSEGGELLCCDGCPGAFHVDCVKAATGFKCPVDGQDWFCQDCLGGTKSIVGDVVWSKIGNHRWWPSQIKEMDECPEIMQRKERQPGEFPVRFLGSHDHALMNHASVITWVDKDDTRRFAKGAKKPAFKKALVAAVEAFSKRQAERKEVIADIKGGVKEAPEAFQRIRANRYECNKPDKLEVTECICTADEGSRCGEDCLNRMMYIECDVKTCPAGKLCQNQRMSKRRYSKIKEFKTEARGWGMRALEDLSPGDLIIEYVGEVIDDAECRRRLLQQEKSNTVSYYMLALDGGMVIDARLKANMARFANHSCSPNCVTQKWNVNGEMRVGIFANEELKAGQEITFDYQLDTLGNTKKVCFCGAPNCSGFIGEKVAKEKADPKSKKRKKKVRKQSQEKRTEDFCFKCSQGGSLIMCDFKVRSAFFRGCVCLFACCPLCPVPCAMCPLLARSLSVSVPASL